MRENLEACLGVSLPLDGDDGAAIEVDAEVAGATATTTKDATECGICLSAELTEEEEDSNDKVELTSIACENPSCQRPYHQTCLHTWLDSLPTSRLAFDVLLGSCPYCKEPIACPIPD